MDGKPYIVDEATALIDQPRQAIRVKRVCDILDCGRSEVYRLIRQGHLEAFNIGGRSKRVYVDSLAQYQREQAVIATGHCPARTEKQFIDRRRAPSVRARAAIAGLEKLGLI